MPMKRIVCLANSWKTGGYCVAGREIPVMAPPRTYGSWIRPVSNRPRQEVSEEEQRYADGTLPRLLDIIDVPLLEHRPEGHQQENWLLDPAKRWQRAAAFSVGRLSDLCEDGGPLWSNDSSSNEGKHNRVFTVQAAGEVNSLRLVQVTDLELDVAYRSHGSGKRVDAVFEFDAVEYKLAVTDPAIAHAYQRRATGSYQLGARYLTISLGEDYDGYCYKLVAAILRTN